jgi:hypothetical protein
LHPRIELQAYSSSCSPKAIEDSPSDLNVGVSSISHQPCLWSDVLAGKSAASFKREIEEYSDIHTIFPSHKPNIERESGLSAEDPISCAARFFVEEVGSTSASDSASPYSDGELPATPRSLVDENDDGLINDVDDMGVLGGEDAVKTEQGLLMADDGAPWTSTAVASAGDDDAASSVEIDEAVRCALLIPAFQTRPFGIVLSKNRAPCSPKSSRFERRSPRCVR